jgi:AraC family transcriptional regulator, regulatory protein of adaptative response / methylphosphotriester-DNA alkyltransferase methyltransferase
MASIPQKILTRKHEIAAQFFHLLDQHIEDILAGKVAHSFKIKDFAERLLIHPTHFSNTIKLVTKRSPNDFVEERLLAEAQRMLGETSMPISDICSKLTFQDPTNFTKLFKRFSGKSPMEYRNQFAEWEFH